MKIETFDLIQQRHTETASEVYRDRIPESDSPHVLYDGTRRAEPLRGWQIKMGHVLHPDRYNVKLPADAEWHQAMFTDPSAEVELSDGARTLSAFVLRNKPVDMGSVCWTKLVISDAGLPDESLVDRRPLLITGAGPSGAYIAESPLLHDDADPIAWQAVISEVLATTPTE